MYFWILIYLVCIYKGWCGITKTVCMWIGKLAFSLKLYLKRINYLLFLTISQLNHNPTYYLYNTMSISNHLFVLIVLLPSLFVLKVHNIYVHTKLMSLNYYSFSCLMMSVSVKVLLFFLHNFCQCYFLYLLLVVNFVSNFLYLFSSKYFWLQVFLITNIFDYKYFWLQIFLKVG